MAFGVKKSFFGRLQEKIEDVIFMRPEIDEEMLDELEEVLITSDIGMDTTMKIIGRLREDIKKLNIRDPEGVKTQIKTIVRELIDKGEAHRLSGETPMIILMIGVNGGGKTTSIAKIANKCKKRRKDGTAGSCRHFPRPRLANSLRFGETESR